MDNLSSPPGYGYRSYRSSSNKLTLAKSRCIGRPIARRLLARTSTNAGPNELMAMGGATGPWREDTEQDIDAYILFLDSLAEFVEQNARLPHDDELHDPF